MKSFYQDNIEWANDMLNTMQDMNENGIYDPQIKTMQDYKNDQQSKLSELNNDEG